MTGYYKEMVDEVEYEASNFSNWDEECDFMKLVGRLLAELDANGEDVRGFNRYIRPYIRKGWQGGKVAAQGNRGWSKLVEGYGDEDSLIASLKQRKVFKSLMTYQEKEEFKALPKEITVYRGGSSEGKSWTLCADSAASFGSVHSKVIKKSTVVGYFSEELYCINEQEIILL